MIAGDDIQVSLKKKIDVLHGKPIWKSLLDLYIGYTTLSMGKIKSILH